MVFTSREKVFYVLEYARTNSNKIVQRAFVRKFSKSHQQQSRFGAGKRNLKTKAVCAERKDLDDQQQQKGRSNGFVKHSCEAPKSP